MYNKISVGKEMIRQSLDCRSRVFMSSIIRPKAVVYLWLGAIVVLGVAGCHSPEHYKSEADEEVYSIIDSKWQ